MDLLHSFVFVCGVAVNDPLCFAAWTMRKEFEILDDFSNLVAFVIGNTNKSSILSCCALLVLALSALFLLRCLRV